MLSVHRASNVARYLGKQLRKRISFTAFIEEDNKRKEPSPQVVFGENEEDVYRRHSSVLRRKGGKSEVFRDKTDEEYEFVDDYEPDDLALDGYVEPHEIVISYLSEDTKMKIFTLHKKEPNRWTALELSKRYAISVHRVKAILHLLRGREELIEELIPSARSREERWMQIYEKYINDPDRNNIDKLSTEWNLRTDQIEDIIIRVKQHKYREANMMAAAEHFDDQLKFLESLGVNTTFAESKPDNKLAKKYFPDLFGDESFERIQNDLRKRILASTRAQPVVEFSSYMTLSEQSKKMWDKVSLEQEKSRSGNSASKSKLAFRDLSGEDDVPIIVRMRNGR